MRILNIQFISQPEILATFVSVITSGRVNEAYDLTKIFLFFLIQKSIIMKFRLIKIMILPLLAVQVHAQEQVKNIILMIPDGTSSSILSLARWYKFGVCPADHCRLAIDPHICGMVSTYNSDSPIGDSAPTGSTYATGQLSNTGFVATYPVSSGKNDLIAVDPDKAYHPLFTILEAAKLLGKSTGVVVTSEFTHATPADFTSHTSDRGDEEDIAIQMVHNHLNVVFGGGLKYLDPARRADGLDLFNVLRTRDYKLATTLESFNSLTPDDTLVYALFTDKDLPYDLDRDPAQIPSLAQMTRQAIRILSQNSRGFFLLVEGSKIDWAAHANDPAGIITEYLAFDDAVEEAMSFANRDGYTAVIVVPDHGNSGISLGNYRSDKNYDELPISDLVTPLRNCKMSAIGISEKIRNFSVSPKETFFEYTGIRLTEEEVNRIDTALKSKNKSLLVPTVTEIISDHTYVGFTTHGHTGEDVMLAVYHPAGYRPSGVIKNTELNHFMTNILTNTDLDSLTSTHFVIDTIALQGLDFTIADTGTYSPMLVIRTNKQSKYRAELKASTDYLTIFHKEKPMKTISLNSLVLYVKPLKHFFVHSELGRLIQKECPR